MTENIYQNQFLKLFIFLVVLLSHYSCTSYRSFPITEEAVSKRLEAPELEEVLIVAETICHPLLKPITIDEKNGLTPDQAAVLAVLINPTLKAERDKKGVAQAQVFQAGILPNPNFTSSVDFPFANILPGTVIAYLVGLTWNPVALLTRPTKIKAAKAQLCSVELSIAWQEWQVAEKAKQQVYRLILLETELEIAKQAEQELRQNRDAVKKAMQQGNKTIIDLSAVEVSLDTAHLATLQIEQNLKIERLTLNETIGLPPDYYVAIDRHIEIPDLWPLPDYSEIFAGIERRRLDLLALKMGYESQQENLRTAIINQLPAINIGPSQTRDNTDIEMAGFILQMELPIFNHNQGIIAIERATRRQLFDEYVSRVFTARSQISMILENMASLQEQIHSTLITVDTLKELNHSYYQALLKGNADVVTYYNSVNNLISNQINLLKLKQLYVDQYIALEIAYGAFLTLNCRD